MLVWEIREGDRMCRRRGTAMFCWGTTTIIYSWHLPSISLQNHPLSMWEEHHCSQLLCRSISLHILIPTCDSVCSKLNPACSYPCKTKCHTGRSMSLCSVEILRPCRCGSMAKIIACHEAYKSSELTIKSSIEENEILSDRPYAALRACGRHQCRRICCSLAALANSGKEGRRRDAEDGIVVVSEEYVGLHECDLVCRKMLSCGDHKCEERDHNVLVDHVWGLLLRRSVLSFFFDQILIERFLSWFVPVGLRFMILQFFVVLLCSVHILAFDRLLHVVIRRLLIRVTKIPFLVLLDLSWLPSYVLVGRSWYLMFVFRLVSCGTICGKYVWRFFFWFLILIHFFIYLFGFRRGRLQRFRF